MEIKKYYSNGKLLFTGEYLVLDGAKALAVPTKYGQTLEIASADQNQIEWTSYDADQSIWFQDILLFEDIIKKRKSDDYSGVKNKLIEILYQAYKQNPAYIDENNGFKIETHLTFPRLWGLGTSSTLINNIAQWLQIDAFELLRKSFGGSGYDVACAQSDAPIIYYLENDEPHFKKVNFNPPFKENIHFVYLNKKQSSTAAITQYFAKEHSHSKVFSKINKITFDALDCQDGRDFALLMEKHQALMSDVLETETVKEKLFPDFKGVIKSLGAWGGDFVMVISKDDPTEYFNTKGFSTILNYSEMVL
ncbi:GHMP kinase [Flavobacterium sediminis]|uniref:GHMP kinase n=1 Tax=Flavobacterium sediminis TaxID=2201181 RepID=A0A2U8QUC5_9FLAO|nr:GYDIA family GHMP kinase [Flavobacterium sediminis]AWM13395.1 GHMP kinase [Flavobacterium sediminis]